MTTANRRYAGSARSEAGPNPAVSYFDAVNGEWSRRYEERSPAGHALRIRKQHVLALLDKPGRVLDAGCGTGMMVQEMTARGWDFWGIDASARMIEVCKRRFARSGQAHFNVGDAARLEFPDGSFDTVLSMGVIDRVPAFGQALSEMLRVLRPGGSAIVVFPNLLGPWAAWRGLVYYPVLRALSGLLYGLRRRRRPESLLTEFPHMFTARSVARLLGGMGGTVTHTVYYNFNLLFSPVDELLPYPAMRLAEALERCSRGPLRWLGGGFIVKVRKPGTVQP